MAVSTEAQVKTEAIETKIEAIGAGSVSAIRDAVNKYSNRSKRLGLGSITLEAGEAYTIEEKHNGRTIKRSVVDIVIKGETPVLSGWRLVGVIEPIGDKGEVLVKTVPGVETLPRRFRTCNPAHCDHCGYDRRRNQTFIVRKGEGRGCSYKQVGRQCLADFLGHKSIGAIASNIDWWLSIASEARDIDHECLGGGGQAIVHDILFFLPYVAVCIRKLGWVSATEAANSFETIAATRSIAFDCCCPNPPKPIADLIREYDLCPTDIDDKLAREALEWARGISPDVKSQYLYNLGVACRQDCVEWKTAGLVASCIRAYHKHLEIETQRREERTKDKDRKHVGTVKERIQLDNVHITRVRSFDTEWGVSTLVQFEDPDGNILVWWSSREHEWFWTHFESGESLNIKATVKKHDDYNGTPQTLINRVQPV